MFELEPSKIDWKNWPWLLIISIVIMLCVIGSTLADPTTAPLNNIVRIHIDSIKGSCGTGFIFEKGRVLTAKHVIEKAKKQLIIRYSNGTIEKVKIKKCRVSKKYDLAEIPVKKDNLGVKLELSSIHYIGKKYTHQATLTIGEYFGLLPVLYLPM